MRNLAFLLMCSTLIPLSFAAEPKLPLKVGEDRRHLVDQRGTPFLYHADTPWMISTKLTEAEAKDYIARRKQQGFTALQVQLTNFTGMTNLAGELPFAGTPPVQGFAQPNDKFFEHVDRVIAEAIEPTANSNATRGNSISTRRMKILFTEASESPANEKAKKSS